MTRRRLASLWLVGALFFTGCAGGVAAPGGPALEKPAVRDPGPVEPQAGPAAETPTTRLDHAGGFLPRCTGWLWEGNKSAAGQTTLEVALVVAPNQPVFPALACWEGAEGSLAQPALRVLQVDGLEVHAARPDHQKQVGNRHLWIFAIDAPPYPGHYFIRFRVGEETVLTFPFEVGGAEG